MTSQRRIILCACLAVAFLIGAHSRFATGAPVREPVGNPARGNESIVASATEGGGVCRAAEPGSPASGSSEVRSGEDNVCLHCTTDPDNCPQICESGVGNCVQATHCFRCRLN